MKRLIKTHLVKDLDEKIVLLSGPRQVGKTHLSKSLPFESEYLNFDMSEHRQKIFKKSWSRKVDLVIFDEIHKMKKWKSWIKGIYDVEGVRPRLLVTGSAKLDVFKKGGDSLAGRHYSYRLHPFSLMELKEQVDLSTSLETLIKQGGFPEPFLEKSEDKVLRWRKSHLDVIIRQDLLDLEQVRDLKSIEILIDLLADRVGSSVSFRSLAEDLQVAPRTVQRWVEILSRLYVIFVVTPYSKNIARAILKEPKIYFYDTGRVTAEGGARLENLVACSLLQYQHFLEDTKGLHTGLHYIRDRDKREVDFLTTINRKPQWLIEVKSSDPTPSSSLLYYSKNISTAKSFQIIHDLPIESSWKEIKIASVEDFLSNIETYHYRRNGSG